MSQDPKSGSRAAGQGALAMLVECDRRGRVLWISPRSRNVFQNPKRLLDIIAVKLLRRCIHGLELSSVSLWKVWESRDRVVIGATGTMKIPEAQNLVSVQRNLAANCFRLVELERRLFERARQRRGLKGRSAIRQVELERQRLGRELHTGVGQMLAAMRWHLEALSTELPTPSPKVQHALESISMLTAQSLEQVRDFSRQLHPPEWQRLTLEEALRQLWAISGIPERLEGTLQIGPLAREPDLEVKVLLYRAFQEALANLARHARATRIEVSLKTRDSRLVLSIWDNGVGFDAAALLAAPANLASGIGLRSIREMAEELGGSFEVHSGPGGTRLVVSLTVLAADDQEERRT